MAEADGVSDKNRQPGRPAVGNGTKPSDQCKRIERPLLQGELGGIGKAQIDRIEEVMNMVGDRHIACNFKDLFQRSPKRLADVREELGMAPLRLFRQIPGFIGALDQKRPLDRAAETGSHIFQNHRVEPGRPDQQIPDALVVDGKRKDDEHPLPNA